MNNDTNVGQQIIALFLLGCLLFNYPLLALMSKTSTLFGIPLVFTYLLTAWLFLIGLAALIASRLK